MLPGNHSDALSETVRGRLRRILGDEAAAAFVGEAPPVVVGWSEDTR